jgi:putative hydrolase of HD superfamily
MTTTMFMIMSADTMDRLQRQIAFLMEIDRLKHIYRQTYLLDKSRHDSDGEHSWHFAVMAMVLSEYAKGTLDEGIIDVCRVMKMALIHDIVEIDTGDVFIYDRKDGGDHYAAEQAAAKRIFGMLPADQAKEYTDLWEEFEARQTPEAKFAAALDRLDPLLHNCYTEGKSWREHGVTADRVLEINSRIGLAAPELWDRVRALVLDCVEKGYLEPGSYSPVKK